MRRMWRPVGVGAATAVLAAATALGGVGGTAFAAGPPTPSGNASAGSSPADSGAGVSTDTGVAVADAAPSGAVMVILKDQLAATPAAATDAAPRTEAAANAQNKVLTDAGVPAQGVKHFTLVNGFATTVTPVQAAKLAKDPRVASIVPDAQVATPVPSSASAGDPATSSLPSGPRVRSQVAPQAKAKPAAPSKNDPNRLCPSDPKKPLLEPEALDVINAANQNGKPSAQSIATGKGVKIAVMAEGLDPNAPDYIRANGKSAIIDYKNFTGAPESAVGYGEEIFGDASSIVAQGRVVHDLADHVNVAHALPQGCNVQVRGVAPDASVVALNILGGGSGGGSDTPSFAFASSIAQAIDYAVSVQHVDILSESIGANQIADQGAQNAVQQFNDAAIAKGVTVFASSGDAGVSGTMGSPAVDPKVIGVAATTSLRAYQQVGFAGTLLSKSHSWLNGNIASFSSGGFGQAGNLPVIAAPGDSGWAACTNKTDKPGCTDYSGKEFSDLELFGGTSQSAPFTAGVGALVIQAYKDGHHGVAPTPAQVRQILTGTATNIGAPGEQQGAGQVDALAAVRLAKSVNAPKASVNAVTVKQDQVQVSGAPGQSTNTTVSVTNQSGSSVVLKPAARELQAQGKPTTGKVSIDPKSPGFLNQSGVFTNYKTVTFKVPAGTDQATLQFAFNKNGQTQLDPLVANINASLISPSGQYAGNTRSQGGPFAKDGSQYGRFDLAKPAPGTWTIVFSASLASKTSGEKTSTATPNTAPINYGVTLNKWANAGTVSTSKLTLKAHATASFTVKTTLPKASGDSTVTVTLGAPTGYSAPTIPISRRVLVPLDANGGKFSGQLTGGNGRTNAPSSQDSYAMNVPKGKTNLVVTAGFPANYSTQAIRVALIDPNGVVQAYQPNLAPTTDASGGLIADSASFARVSVVDPIPGQWRIVVWQLAATFGAALHTPYNGTVAFTDSSVKPSAALSALDPSNPSITTLPAGERTDLELTVTNNSGVVKSFVVDPRTATLERIEYPTHDIPVPSDVLGILGDLVIGPQTSRIDSVQSAAIPLQASIAAPGVYPALAGLTAVGATAQVVNGTATSTATLSTPSGYLPFGAYSDQAGVVGPTPAAGSARGTAKVAPVVYAAGYDLRTTTDAGDPYAFAAQGQTKNASLLSLKAGASAKIKVHINPDPSQTGSVVQGQINVLQYGTPGLVSVLSPALNSSDESVGAVKYRYRVGTAAPQVTGTVKGNGGNPLPNVTVKLFDSTGKLATSQITGESGEYSVAGLNVGQKYSVCFDADTMHGNASYGSQCYQGVNWDGASPVPPGTKAIVAPAAGQPLAGVDAQLKSSGAIEGMVTGDDGRPLAGVAITAVDSHGGIRLMTQVRTDASGRYRLAGFDQDPVLCALTWPGYADNGLSDYLSDCGGKFAVADFFHLVGSGVEIGTKAPDGGQPTKIVSGQTVQRDIRLAKGGTIQGTIVDQHGKPVADAAPMAVLSSGLPTFGSSTVNSDSQGHFTLSGVPAEAVAICASNDTLGGCTPDSAVTIVLGQPLPSGFPTHQYPLGATTSGVSIKASALPKAGGSPTAQLHKLEAKAKAEAKSAN